VLIALKLRWRRPYLVNGLPAVFLGELPPSRFTPRSQRTSTPIRRKENPDGTCRHYFHQAGRRYFLVNCPFCLLPLKTSLSGTRLNRELRKMNGLVRTTFLPPHHSIRHQNPGASIPPSSGVPPRRPTTSFRARPTEDEESAPARRAPSLRQFLCALYHQPRADNLTTH